jgi:hypothetical protein
MTTRFTGANQIVDGGRILVDQNISAWALPEVSDEARAQMAVADDNDVIFHFAGKHAPASSNFSIWKRVGRRTGAGLGRFGATARRA